MGGFSQWRPAEPRPKLRIYLPTQLETKYRFWILVAISKMTLKSVKFEFSRGKYFFPLIWPTDVPYEVIVFKEKWNPTKSILNPFGRTSLFRQRGRFQSWFFSGKILLKNQNKIYAFSTLFWFSTNILPEKNQDS